jgi:ABC-type antimicrobial peptide transport system permease subunit
MALFLKTEAEPGDVIPAVRRVVAAIDPGQPVSDETTLEGLARASLRLRELTLAVVSALGLSALALAVAGVFAVLSRLVAQRTREIGVRVALGAARLDVLRLVMGRSLLLVSLGVTVGMGAALALGRFQGALLYGVEPGDPATLLAVALLMLVAALPACALPARRAARLDPLTALREE